MIKLNYFLVILLVFSCFSSNEICLAQKRERLKATGEVVGFDRFASLANLTSAPQSQTVIVRIDKIIKGKQSQPYIIVLYQGWASKASLPKEMFDGKSKWKFELTRDKICDSKWVDIMFIRFSENAQENHNYAVTSRFEWTSSKPDIADEVKLPCYILKKKGYKILK